MEKQIEKEKGERSVHLLNSHADIGDPPETTIQEKQKTVAGGGGGAYDLHCATFPSSPPLSICLSVSLLPIPSSYQYVAYALTINIFLISLVALYRQPAPSAPSSGASSREIYPMTITSLATEQSFFGLILTLY